MERRKRAREGGRDGARACVSEGEGEARKRTARAPSPRSSVLISKAQDEAAGKNLFL